MILADVNPADIEGIRIVSQAKKKTSVKVGDIIAIPADNGEYFIAVVLAKNAFGVAYGFFKEQAASSPYQKTHIRPLSRTQSIQGMN